MSALTTHHDPATSKSPGHPSPTPSSHAELGCPVKRSSKLTLGGIVYIGLTLFLAVGAINSQNNLLFWLFGVAIATLLVSGGFSGFALMRVRLEAHAIPDPHAGETLRIHYVLSNTSRFFPVFAILISEIQSDRHPQGEFMPAPILHLGPKQHAKGFGTLVPTHRGRYALDQIRLSTRFPFGLLQKSLIFECHRSFLVMPYQLPITSNLVRPQHNQAEESQSRSAPSGASNQYWGLREYTPGDSKRSIAWKQSARHTKLIVIEHAQPVSSKLWVWISSNCFEGANQADHASSERAIALCASVITFASAKGIPVGLWVPAYDIRMSPGAGKASMMRALRALAVLDLNDPRTFDRTPNAPRYDDVLKIVPHAQGTPSPSSARQVDAQQWEDWLTDPQLLPPALHSHREITR